MSKIKASDLTKFSITASEANSKHITLEDLKGITEILPNRKYRIVISNGFNIDGSRNRISATVDGTLVDAINKKNEIKKEIVDNKKSANAYSNFESFSEVYINYLKEKIKNGQLEETTFEGYYGLINLRILPYFKDFILQDINEETVENWLGYLSRTKTKSGNFVHPTTIAHAFKVLSNMFNFAKLERILKENPCSFVKKKPTEKPDEKEYFTLEEMDYVKELLSTTNIRLKTAMFIIMDTGCRREELLGLTWRDIDFEKKTININKAVATISTKSGVPSYRIVEKNVKSRNSNRVIGIPNACISLLKQYKAFKKDSGLKVKADDYVFTNWDNNTIWDPNRLTAEWRLFRKNNNITKNVPLHGLRHSNATFLLSSGMPKKDVAKRLGHTTEVLDRIYTHSGEEDDKKLVEKIEESFYGNKEKYQRKFSTNAIISVIAGYIDNENCKENYELLDYIVEERVNNENLVDYLKASQDYLISQYPILSIFNSNEIISSKEVFNERMKQFIDLVGEKLTVKLPQDKIKDYGKTII